MVEFGHMLSRYRRIVPIACLSLQRETLLRQLETNQLDIDATLEELTVQQETEDQNYDMYVPARAETNTPNTRVHTQIQMRR